MPNTDEQRIRRNEYMSRYAKEYRRAHPETIMRQRLRSARRLLERNGYTVDSTQAEDEGRRDP